MSVKTHNKTKLVPVNRSVALLPERDASISPILECIDLGVTFGGLKAVDNFDITIGRTEIAGLIGPNGAGKTTIFNLLTKVYQPTLMSHPKLLMLDEPSMGLAPILVEQIFGIIRELHASGTTILLVEQNAQAALEVADRAYVLETGRIVLSGTGAELMASDQVQKAYLGG